MRFENHIEYNEHNEILMPVLEIFLSCNGEGTSNVCSFSWM